MVSLYQINWTVKISAQDIESLESFLLQKQSPHGCYASVQRVQACLNNSIIAFCLNVRPAEDIGMSHYSSVITHWRVIYFKNLKFLSNIIIAQPKL